MSDKPSLGKRFVGAIIGSIIVAIIATFAWQAYSDDQIKAWWPSIHSKELKPSSDLAANVALQSSNQITAATSVGTDTGRGRNASRATAAIAGYIERSRRPSACC